jgi:hypothetical protein
MLFGASLDVQTLESLSFSKKGCPNAENRKPVIVVTAELETEGRGVCAEQTCGLFLLLLKEQTTCERMLIYRARQLNRFQYTITKFRVRKKCNSLYPWGNASQDSDMMYLLWLSWQVYSCSRSAVNFACSYQYIILYKFRFPVSWYMIAGLPLHGNKSGK